MRLWAESELIRAAPGGLGAAKTGGNYAAGLAGQLRARENGFDDVIWLDAITRRELARLEERRVGKECVSTWRSRGSQIHSTKNRTKDQILAQSYNVHRLS